MSTKIRRTKKPIPGAPQWAVENAPPEGMSPMEFWITYGHDITREVVAQAGTTWNYWRKFAYDCKGVAISIDMAHALHRASKGFLSVERMRPLRQPMRKRPVSMEA